MACTSRRIYGWLLLSAAALLSMAYIPTTSSSELEEWDLFAGRELLQVQPQGGVSRPPPPRRYRPPPPRRHSPPPVYYPPKNDTQPPVRQ
jgi:hypothetical protein